MYKYSPCFKMVRKSGEVGTSQIIYYLLDFAHNLADFSGIKNNLCVHIKYYLSLHQSKAK